MNTPNPDIARRRIVERPQNSLKIRLAALREMAKPSLAFLGRLQRDETTPHRLLLEVVRRADVERLVRKGYPATGQPERK